MAQAGLRLKSHIQLESEVFGFVLVRVISWIVFIYLDKRNDPRSHTNYTRTRYGRVELFCSLRSKSTVEHTRSLAKRVCQTPSTRATISCIPTTLSLVRR